MRPARARIDLSAIRHNLALAGTLARGAEVVAVVKANGYGHGAARILPALDDAPRLAVACIEEALALRRAGARQPILLLEGVFEAGELARCASESFAVVVHEPGQIAMLEATAAGERLDVWLKVDSGMGRLGFRPAEVAQAHPRLAACAAVRRVDLMTHLATAEEDGGAQTRAQLDSFASATAGMAGRRSICNSAGTLLWPSAHADMVRPGIMLYGVSPTFGTTGGTTGGKTGSELGLRPAMTLETRLIAVKPILAGEPVGYAATWRAPRDGRIGIAAMGYGDGYPRHAPSGTPVLLDGRRAAIVGRVSMDMIAIDLTGHDEARVGAPVTLWGPGLPVEEIAACASTIGYELLCGITQRVHVEVVG